MRRQQGRGDFDSLSEVEHPAQRFLWKCKHRGAPVVLMTGEWTEGKRLEALKRGPHKSATEHTRFINDEFASIVEKYQWMVLPYSMDKQLR